MGTGWHNWARLGILPTCCPWGRLSLQGRAGPHLPPFRHNGNPPNGKAGTCLCGWGGEGEQGIWVGPRQGDTNKQWHNSSLPHQLGLGNVTTSRFHLQAGPPTQSPKAQCICFACLFWGSSLHLPSLLLGKGYSSPSLLPGGREVGLHHPGVPPPLGSGSR